MKPLLSLLAFVLIVAGSSASAQNRAANPEPYGDHTFRHLISVQLERSLDSPLAMVRAQTLKNAVVFSTIYRDRADLNGAVTKIAELAKGDENVQNRRLAVAALRAIGSSRANRHLDDLEPMHEDEYRSLVAGVISEYFEANGS